MIRKFFILLLSFALLLSVTGCGDLTAPDPTAKPSSTENPHFTHSTEPTASGKDLPEDGVYDIGEDLLPVTQTQLYQQLFDRSNKIEIDLDMDDAELLKLQQDYDRYRDKGSKSPIYRKGDLTVSITDGKETTLYRIRDVGVRMKGNTSRTDFYNPEEGIYNYIHLRLDFQETFDKAEYYGSDAQQWSSDELRQARKDRTFATLEKLELRWNKCYDATYLKETYAYELYRSEGVLAPHSNLSSFSWNDKGMGVYTLVEPVDEIFLSKHLGEEDLGGDLYKCGWTWTGATFTNLQSVGIENEDNSEFYCYDLKSNKKTSQHEALTALINGLTGAALTKDRYAQLVDVDYFLNYAAVSYFLGNPDDLRNNYNNCYLYFLKSSGKAIIIPYDYDRCLGVTQSYNPSGHAMTQENPFSDRAEGMQNGPEEQTNPLFIHSVDKGGYYVAEFAAVLERVAANELLKPETFGSWYHTASYLYSGDVTPERNLHNAEGRDFSFDLNRTGDPGSQDNLSFKDYISAKMKAFQGYMKDLDTYLNYQRPVPKRYFIRGDFNDWSNRDEYALDARENLMVFTLQFSHNFAFKVYDDLTGEWYGVDFLPEEVREAYETDGHGNIRLGPGTYQLTFDPEALIITIT